ncbi:MAG: hypothetical protein RMJ31_07235 [Nitrososphaerota archaeon]|nr:hypothetical protein [Nitrososphaerales archaeon]MDW8045544.1 hypothetical protein [Nitrososphaerota archaeon]
MREDECSSLERFIIDIKAIELASNEQISRSKQRIARRKRARYEKELHEIREKGPLLL